jgi:hypothetical protein
LPADITRRKNLHKKRRHRSYPRVVKRARHNSYRVKQATEIGVRHTGPPAIDLVNLRPPRRQPAPRPKEPKLTV